MWLDASLKSSSEQVCPGFVTPARKSLQNQEITLDWSTSNLETRTYIAPCVLDVDE